MSSSLSFPYPTDVAAIIYAMLRRRLLVFLIFFVFACQTLAPLPEVTPENPVNTPSPTPTATQAVASPTATSPALPSPVPSPSKAAVSTTNSYFSVNFHPDGPLYVGDIVSLEVIPPQGADLEGRSVEVRFDSAPGPEGEVGPIEAKFAPYGIGARLQATFLWVWDTSGLAPGEHYLNFSVAPDGPNWTESVSLLPSDEVPPPEPGAAWATAESDCCLVHYIRGTAAERDLDKLLAMVDEQAEDVSRQMGVDLASLTSPIEVTFLPRVLGHGGFTSQEVSVSYLDRNYAGNGTPTVLHHEIVHLLDSHLGGDLRPTILIEGLAVFLTGGHFKPEPLMPRAAMLLPPEPGCVQFPSTIPGEGCSLDVYIPLKTLVDNFYMEPHEIGYLEAGSLVEFMVDTWGWEAFSDFYRHIHALPEPPEDVQEPGGPQYRAMNAALVERLGITIQQLENRFLAALKDENSTPEMAEDVRQTVAFYNEVRAYQQVLDPSAYFLYAWLPSEQQMRARGIVADFLRRPSTPENLAMETMLVAADQRIRAGEYQESRPILVAVNDVLDGYTSQAAYPFQKNDLAANYLALVKTIEAAGYQPQKIQLTNQKAQVWVSISGPDLFEFNLVHNQNGWEFYQGVGLSLDVWRFIYTAPAYLQR
jgi:hypothetical protein